MCVWSSESTVLMGLYQSVVCSLRLHWIAKTSEGEPIILCCEQSLCTSNCIRSLWWRWRLLVPRFNLIRYRFSRSKRQHRSPVPISYSISGQSLSAHKSVVISWHVCCDVLHTQQPRVSWARHNTRSFLLKAATNGKCVPQIHVKKV